MGAAEMKRFWCYQCDSETKNTPLKEIYCNQCGSKLQAYRAKIAWAAKSQNVRALADGPKTMAEIPAGMSTYRDLVFKLPFPKSRHAGNGRGTDIYYLAGDERPAVRRFIEENREFVERNVNGKPTLLQDSWPEEFWQLLLEQYYWTHE